MSRLTGTDAYGLMEAYQAVYAPQVNEDYLWESYLTEEFISEAYQTVADYLVYNGFVPGYNTAEVYMSEMAVEDIDAILFETGVLDEQYLMEAGFFQNAANSLIGGVKRAGSAVAGGVRNVASGADRAVSGAVRAGQTAVGAVKRAGSAVAGGVQRAGQTVAGAAQRAGGAVQRAVTPVAQAVKGTAQRAVSAGQSALGGAARAVQGAGQAVVGGVQRAGQAAAGAAAATGRKISQEIEISRKVGAGEPLSSAVTASAKPTPQRRGLGNIPPAEGTGIGGPSDVARRYGRDTTSYQAGGGARTGQSVQATMQQGRTNLGRMDQGKPAPAGAKPTSGGSSVNPKSGLSAYSANSSASASRPAASASRPAAGAPATPKPAAPAGGSALDRATAAAGRPAAFSPKPQSDVGRMIDASKARQAAQTPKPATPAPAARPMGNARERMLQRQSFDVFDVIKGHLIDEGYADTEESALVIMANMSEEWRQSIVEGATGVFVPSRVDDFNNRRDMLKNRYGQDVGPRIPGPSGGGQYGEPPAPKAGVLKLARGTSSLKRGVESKNNA